jgi:hypothetical protein
MSMKAILIVLVIGIVICVVTSYFLYTIFEPWGVGWVGIVLSIVFFLFVLGGVSRAMMMRKT